MEPLLFYAFSGLLLLAALLVITSRFPVYSLLYLLVVMFCLAGLYIMLQAYFVAALQVLVYAGAILVLFLFVIMLLDLDPQQLRQVRQSVWTWVGGGVGLLFALALTHTWRSLPPQLDRALPTDAGMAGSTAALGRLLFSDYILPFEVVSLLILAAIVGAVALAKQKADL